MNCDIVARVSDAGPSPESRLGASSNNVSRRTSWKQSVSIRPELPWESHVDLAGIVRNGVIVVNDGRAIPEGTCVRMSVMESKVSPPQHRVTFPFVPTENPGSLHLTNEIVG